MEVTPLVANPVAQVERVETVLIPAPGFTVDQVLADAQLEGYESVTVCDDGTILVVWYTNKERADA